MEKIVSWGLRSILGLTLGLQILQSLVLPYADSAGQICDHEICGK